MKMSAFGFDLSESSIRFMDLVPRGQGFDLGDYGAYPIPEGVISLGSVQKSDILRDILRKIKKEHQVSFVRLSLSEMNVYHVEIEIAKVKKSEIRESIELQLEEYVPLKVSEVFFDYDIRESTKQKDFFVAVVSVVPKDIVLSYMEVFASAGLKLLSVDADANALARAVIPKDNMGTFMIIDAGKNKTGVSIVSRRLVRFTSDIDLGGRAVVSAIQKSMNVTLEEAENLKERCYEGGDIPEKVEAGLISVFAGLGEELNKHFVYWHTHKDKDGVSKEKIEKIFLIGTEATLSGFREYLAGSLRTPVEMANVWTNVLSFEDHIPKISLRESLCFATAIGLSLAVKE